MFEPLAPSITSPFASMNYVDFERSLQVWDVHLSGSEVCRLARLAEGMGRDRSMKGSNVTLM